MTGDAPTWLTPSLLSAAVVMVGFLLHSIAAMRRDLTKALQQLVKHETVLKAKGFFEPHS